MTKQQQRLNRIKAIERQYQVAELATRMLQDALRANPSLLKPRRLNNADLQRLVDNLETTCVVRLFAEFEAGLRDIWANWFKRKTTPRMDDLLESLAGRCRISDEHLKKAHTVRKYRNSLVHEGGEKAARISLSEARKYLCTFFSFMPRDW